MSLGAVAGVAAGAAGAAAAIGLEVLMKTHRAKFIVYAPKLDANGKTGMGAEESDQEIEFTYNPKEFKFGRAVEMNTSATQGAEGQNRQLIGPKPRSFSFDITFDKFEMMALGSFGDASNLQKIADKLLYLTTPHKDTLGDGATPALPVLVFQWGDIHTEPSFCDKVDLTYTQFLPTGDPLRLKATVSMSEIDMRTPRQNPTSGSDKVRKSHTLLLGETLASVAYREYGDAGCWRAIADENGLDDPLRLRPGQLLLLPPRDEAKASK